MFGGFTEKQLEEAFNKVKDTSDWKAPIKAVVEKKDISAVREAIVFYTATEPIFIQDGNNYRVEADGYRLGPAGDH